jgi:hypothetical protein
MASASRTDHKLLDSVSSIQAPAGIHGSKAFIIVVVAIQDHFRPGVV